MIKRLVRIMLVIFCVGWLLYAMAIISHGSSVDKFVDHNGAEVLFYSASCAVDMFMLDINGNVIDNIDGLAYLKSSIMVTAMAAFLSTLMFLLGLIMTRYMSYRHAKALKLTSVKNELYIFFGTNVASQLLAKSIKEEDNGAKSLIFFVERTLRNEDDTDGWENIISQFTHRREVFEAVDMDDHEGLLISTMRVGDINDPKSDIWKTLNLEVINDLLRDPNLKKVHFFFLSDDRESNISATIKLSQHLKWAEENGIYKASDEEEKPGLISRWLNKIFSPKQQKQEQQEQQPSDTKQGQKQEPNKQKENVVSTIYCLSRNDGVSQTLLEFLPDKNRYVKIIDNSRISIDLLRKDIRNHPIKFVDIDTEINPGTITSAFNSLIIGFGETGRDAAKFLYEFGAFLSSESDANHTVRSPFRCDIVDVRCNRLKGKFMANRPRIFGKDANARNLGTINFHNIDVYSDIFYKRLFTDSYIQDLNYILIATGNEDNNLSIALDLLRYVVQHRKNLRHFKILVRVYDTVRKLQIDNIVNHYNVSILGEEMAKNNPIIDTFGESSEIFRQDIIINDSLDKDALLFMSKYDDIKQTKPEERADIKKMREAAFKSGKGHLMEINKYRRKWGQNRANAQHQHTKIEILKACISPDTDPALVSPVNVLDEKVKSNPYHDLKLRLFPGDNDKAYVIGINDTDEIIYPDLSDKEMQIIRNLAILEHLRWNAAHEMLGYVFDTNHETHDLEKTHNCLTDWECLDMVSEHEKWKYDYKYFDFLVAETSIFLWMGDNRYITVKDKECKKNKE